MRFFVILAAILLVLLQLLLLNDTVQEELDDVGDSPAETTYVLVDEPPMSAKNLLTDIQTFSKR